LCQDRKKKRTNGTTLMEATRKHNATLLTAPT
jgi:hypothetical protein